MVGVFSLFVSRLLLSRKNFSSEFATLHLVFADRRRPPGQRTFVEPCSIQTKKAKQSKKKKSSVANRALRKAGAAVTFFSSWPQICLKEDAWVVLFL